jgi:hypothetical protein
MILVPQLQRVHLPFQQAQVKLQGQLQEHVHAIHLAFQQGMEAVQVLVVLVVLVLLVLVVMQGRVILQWMVKVLV